MRLVAISCTDYGEFFIQHGVASDISTMLKYQNISLNMASNNRINKLTKIAGTGGIIGLNKNANIMMKINTDGMYSA